jgi:hypothetical protein
MLISAMNEACEDWEVRKKGAEGGRGRVVKEPGSRRMSNWGAFTKEFCHRYQRPC